MSFEHAFNDVILIEGGYSDNPADSGGKTMWGITEALARKWAYHGEMRNMPIEIAEAIYNAEFWHPLKLDDIDEVSPLLAREMFELSVNSGPGLAARTLQRLLKVLNRNQRDYPDIKVDGSIGSKTIETLKAFKRVRGDKGLLVLHKAMNCLQGAFLIELAERREKDEEFIYGWLTNRISL